LTISASYSPCVSTDGSGITAGTVSTLTETLNDSCQPFLGGVPNSTVTIHWSNGDSSTFNYTTISAGFDGNWVVTLTGKIIAGRYVGQMAVKVLTLTGVGQSDFLTACQNGGFTQLNGTAVLTVLPGL
jgi:hypothetical protein